jgi:hypothetical protein
VSFATAQKYVGRTIIIGITYLRRDGTLREQEQMHGLVSAIDEHGIKIRLSDGRWFNLPPDLRAIRLAPRGQYRFRSTGEIVNDPDLMTTWTVTQPDS